MLKSCSTYGLLDRKIDMLPSDGTKSKRSVSALSYCVSRLESLDKKSPRNVRPDFTHLFERMSVT